MHQQPRQSPARVLAPLALAVCTVAFLYIVFTSGSSDNGSTGGQSASKTTTSSSSRSGAARAKRAHKRTYTVKTGDTLGGIAAKTGLSVEKLQELNPQLDPQALVSGQKIKLRE